MAASGNPNLVDELEQAFQNCISGFTSQEYFNINETDEVKASVDQSVTKFMDIARQLDSYFFQKRLALSVYKPEQIVKEDIKELQLELARKDALIQKNYEKLQQWQKMLTQAQTGQSAPLPPPPMGPQQMPPGMPQQGIPPQGMPPQMQQPQQVPQVAVSAAAAQQLNLSAVQQQMHNHYPAGPLAYLEQTTSSIGLPERR